MAQRRLVFVTHNLGKRLPQPHSLLILVRSHLLFSGTAEALLPQ